ncbi:MAG: hypothetical protein ABF876_05425 [Acetobacter aceti]
MPDTPPRPDSSVCSFFQGTWECRGDGYLWDADRDVCNLEDLSHPCPRCNTERYLQEAKQLACDISSASSAGAIFSGADTMRDAFRTAWQENPDVAIAAMRALSPVATWEYDAGSADAPPGRAYITTKEIMLLFKDFEAMIPVLHPVEPFAGGLQ